MTDGIEARLSVVEYKVDQMQATQCVMDAKLDLLLAENTRSQQRAAWFSTGGKMIAGVVIGVVVPWVIAVVASSVVWAIRAAPASAP